MTRAIDVTTRETHKKFGCIGNEIINCKRFHQLFFTKNSRHLGRLFILVMSEQYLAQLVADLRHLGHLVGLDQTVVPIVVTSEDTVRFQANLGEEGFGVKVGRKKT